MQKSENAINILYLQNIYVHNVIKLIQMIRRDLKQDHLRKLMCKSYETDIHNTHTFGRFVHAKIRKKLN